MDCRFLRFPGGASTAPTTGNEPDLQILDCPGIWCSNSPFVARCSFAKRFVFLDENSKSSQNASSKENSPPPWRHFRSFGEKLAMVNTGWVRI